VDGYLSLAHGFTTMRPPLLMITRGFSGSGKTTLTTPLLEQMDLIRIRSDIERKRLFGLGALERTSSETEAGIYTPAAGAQTYAKLEELASIILESGYSALVDATCLKLHQRERFRKLAQRLQVPFLVLDFRAPATVLRQRIAGRERAGTDASEATLAVLEHQLDTAEPLQDDERDDVVVIDSTKDDASAKVLERLGVIGR
jgi:predicted kinase